MKPGPKSGPANKPKNNKRKPASKVRQRDPFYARECEKYDNPLPSREYVLQLFEERGVPVDMISTGPDREETIVLRHPFKP